MRRIDLRFLGSKTVDAPLRTAHVAAMALLVGGQAFAPADPSLRSWQLLTVVTGVALLFTEAIHSRHWVYQGRGVLALAHVGLAALAAAYGLRAAAAALLVGAVGSHLPRGARWWSLLHGRVLE